jgi:uncharacterized protein YcfL
MKNIGFLVALLCLVGCQDDKEQPSENPWDAQLLVERIATDENWEQQYPDANITTEARFVREYNGTRTVKTLYPDSNNELYVIYRDSVPEDIFWYQTGDWTTDYGSVGQSIEVLENVNEAAVEFYGLGYDVPGLVEINNGKLAQQNIQFTVRPTADTIPSEFYSYGKFSSSSQEAQNLDLYISRVTIPIPDSFNKNGNN